jgi:hypothetical protein
MSRGKYLSLEEARKKHLLDRFCKEHPSTGDKEAFDGILDGLMTNLIRALKISELGPFDRLWPLFETLCSMLQQVAEQAIKAVLVIPLLVLLALLSGCALLDRATDLSSRAFAEMSGGDITRVGDPLYLHLQLALLSDKVVMQILQKTETVWLPSTSRTGGRPCWRYASTTPPQCGTRRRARAPTPTP